MQIVTKCDIMLVSRKFPDRRVKYYDTSAAHIRSSAESSLKRLGIEVIDRLLLEDRMDFLVKSYVVGMNGVE